MKILAVLCGMFGLSSLSVAFQEPGSMAIGIVMSALFFFGAYKLWTRKSKKKQVPVEEPTINPYMDMNAPLAPIDFPKVIMRGGEKVYFAIPAETFVNKTRVTGYESDYAGGSVRVAKGVSVRSGKRETTAVRQNVNDIIGKGDYVVTNKRVMFIGLGDSFDIPLAKITSVSMVANNGFVIITGGKAHNVTAGNPGSQYACDATLELVNMFAE